MEKIHIVNTDKEDLINVDDNNIVVKLVDNKNTLVAEYVFKQEKLKLERLLYYSANNTRCCFHRYDEKNKKIEISPNEKMEIISSSLLLI